MNEPTNTLNDHARVRIRTSIRSDHEASKYVPGWRTNMRYQEKGLVHNKDHNYVTYVTKQDKESINSTHSLHSNSLLS